jgi:hypothetical protein
MKLELKHLAPYLPYGLNFYYFDEERERSYHNSTIDWMEPAQGSIGEVTIGHEDGSEDMQLGDLKPILRPLSDLTKEIEHNGERFVPIIELNRMRGVTVEPSDYKELFDDREAYGCKWGFTYSFYFDKQTMSFYDNQVAGVSPQWDMFQKLIEWHFDVFNLIDQGLAVDINTLKP